MKNNNPANLSGIKVPITKMQKWTKLLSDNDMGILVKAMLVYTSENIEPQFTGNLRKAWEDIAPHMVLF